MKVMLVVPHLSDGGGERIVSDLSRSLKAEELILLVFERRLDYPFSGRVVSLDMPIERRSLFSRAVGFINRARRFRRVLQQERPDVVLSFMGEANLINALLSARPIVTVHNLSGLAGLNASGEVSRIRRARKWMERCIGGALSRVLLRRATIVAVSEAVQKELIERFRVPDRQVIVISNAVNVAEIQQRASERVSRPWSDDGPVIITAGRLTLAKGHWHLIRAFAESRRQRPCQLVILGAGELEEYLIGLTKQLGIERDVFFPGWQANPYKFIARADLFVLSSLTEGFGLVLLEAMACGVPVVTANCPGPPAEIVAPGIDRATVLEQPRFGDYGILVPAFDEQIPDALAPCTPAEQHLADVIVQVLGDAPLRERYAKAGLQRVRDFDHESFVGKYERLIKTVS